MGLERRKNNYYYYEKERIGEKVRSVYSGKGDFALMLQYLREDRRQEKVFEKQQNNSEKLNEETELENILDSFSEISKILTDGFLLTNGFHQHKRQWRRKRNVTGKIK